ncbi:MAG: alpha/beta hydrolase-fold protein [Planctomycetota bacterium]|nr:alpha/beta hydrolase-fold protein [Planctomycetota bacterium]
MRISSLFTDASRWLVAAALVTFCLSGEPATAADYAFELSFPATARAEPFTGRVYLFFQKGKGQEPRLGPNWFNPEPMVAIDVKDWKPGETLEIGTANSNRLIVFPKALADLDLKDQTVQAVARFNPLNRKVGDGPGNAHSSVAKVEGVDGKPAGARLVLDQIVPERVFPENKWCKLLEIHGGRLTEFHGRDVPQRACVLLPASYYTQPDRRYPTIFVVSGFGGDHFAGLQTEPVKEDNPAGVEFIRVFLDADCPLGHHVFADSANNGPVGGALVGELIPTLDKKFRTIAAPTARFLTGHSSGGWSTLWLQVAYPETFGGCWSTAPDPVDFHDFQRIDMYRVGENMYRDPKGERRPLARSQGRVFLWYDDFDRMEELVGPGGQLHSFEAVFSPRGKDGTPVRMWNRETGVVDVEAAKAWEKYDIRLILESRWNELGPKLAGKLHVFMGEEDTFYLEGATKRLKESLLKLNSDAVVELFPGKDHGSLMTRELVTRIRAEMVQSFLKHHKVQ